jgi:hypothetical protein
MMFCILKANRELTKTYLELPKNRESMYFEKSPITKSKTDLHIEKLEPKLGPIFQKNKEPTQNQPYNAFWQPKPTILSTTQWLEPPMHQLRMRPLNLFCG